MTEERRKYREKMKKYWGEPESLAEPKKVTEKRYRDRLRAEGFVQKTIWIRKECEPDLRKFLDKFGVTSTSR
jgi:hypothetical protein